MWEVRAPGKVVILGEYAVLDGSPALVVAVDSGVRCLASPASTLSIETPGDDRFVRAALVDATGSFAFDIYNPVRTEGKPGLGGSAAATVAAVSARRALTGHPEDVHGAARRVHLGVQGSGSGIDVAASALGGTLRFEAGEASAAQALHPVVIWSGKSARTGPRIAQYQAWQSRNRFVDASRQLVDGFASDPPGALRAGGALLGEMADSAGISYWTPALREICALAGRFGGGAKPSGAGGGDCAVALFESADADAAFRAACADAGYTVLAVEPSVGVSAVLKDSR